MLCFPQNELPTDTNYCKVRTVLLLFSVYFFFSSEIERDSIFKKKIRQVNTAHCRILNTDMCLIETLHVSSSFRFSFFLFFL